MCGFHEFKQGLPAGLLPSPGNRLESRVSLRLSLQVLLGRLQRLSPDTNGRADEEKTTFHTTQGSYTEAGMLRDIEEMFCTLCKINMKLNPKKSEKSLPIFKTLKKCIKKSDFHWTPEAKQAFKQSKQHLSELPLLVAPKPKEELIVYLLASYGAISAVLMSKRGTVQTSVYFVSSALQGLELNYTPMEKLVLSLFFAAKRVRRMVTEMECHAGRTQYYIPPKDVGERTDTGGLPHRSGMGLILTSPEGTEFTYVLWFQFTTSNNEAQYEALIAGLRIAAQIGVRNVTTSRLRPYYFTYLERELTMEEMLYKFIDEGKQEHEEMRGFIYDFQTTNELLFKERNNSLIELIFRVQELFKVIKNVPMIDCEVKGVTTRGGKTTTQDVQDNNINVQPEEPPVVDLDKMVGSNKVLTKNQPEKINESAIQPSSDVQTPPVPFLRRLRKEKEVAQQKKFLENLNNSTFIFRLSKP
ncbi:reverse transcriptase domain-containing protein [Tanacetum coccineum]